MASGDVFTFNGRYTHEQYSLAATCVLGMRDGSIAMTALESCAGGHLSEVRVDASYYWRNKVGATVGAFSVQGSSNPSLYAANRTAKPTSSGIMLQLDGTPFGGSDSPLGPRFNIRMGVQYTAHDSSTAPGATTLTAPELPRPDNNTLRVFTWLAF